MRLFCVLATAALLAACGGGKAHPAPSATATVAPEETATASPAPPKLTSASDLAACAQLERAVQAVSALVGHTTEGITRARHPRELAKRMRTAQHSLLDSAKLVELVHPPEALAGPQLQFVEGLRMFAGDFGRAKVSAAQGDIGKAAGQTVDERALRKLQKSAKRIDDLCGA